MGIKHLALADTVGSSTPENIKQLFTSILPEMKGVALGAHLHSTKEKSLEKIAAAYESGCTLFDVAIHGFGGCPMAAEELTGNVATEDLLSFMESNKLKTNLNQQALDVCLTESWKIFNKYH